MSGLAAASDLAAGEESLDPRQPEPPRLELRHIHKSFGGVRVLEDVSFHLAAGEVVGLLGDNGAGKSTLIKIITGVHAPDEGEIVFRGKRVEDLDVHKARDLGVETVFQERALAEQLPLWRNIFMGRALTGRFGMLRVAEMRRITQELMSESMGFTSAVLTPDTTVTGLSGGERQGLAIVRALHFEADIIVLDEPTMGLSLKETEKLLRFCEGIRDAGKSAIFIDHNIFHVYSVADRIVILDRGRVAGEFPTSRYKVEELMDIMREIASSGVFQPDRDAVGETPRGDPLISAPQRRDVNSGPIAAPRAGSGRGALVGFTTRWASQIGITVAFLLLWLLFIVLAPGTFTSERIYLSFAQTTPYFAIVAMALTMVIVAGDIDLSFPSIMALGMVGFVWVWEATGSVLLGAGTALAVGAAAGLFNGLVVTIVGIPSLVVTIGTQFLFRGLVLVLVAGKSTALVEARDDPFYSVIVGKPFLGIPMEFWWLVLVTIGAWVLLNRHRLGQNAYVVGDNRQAAQLMGIPIKRTRVMLFVLTGLAAALAGMLNSLQVVNFYPNMGSGYLLPTLAAVFVGGTSVFGGRGSVWGTFIGAFMIGGITAGILAAGWADFWTNLIYGAIILISVSIHAILQRRFQR